MMIFIGLVGDPYFQKWDIVENKSLYSLLVLKIYTHDWVPSSDPSAHWWAYNVGMLGRPSVVRQSVCIGIIFLILNTKPLGQS